MTYAQSAYAVRSYQFSSAAVAIDASPHRQVALLYDEALERLNKAVAAVRQHNVVGKLRSVDGALEIIKYLRSVLDFQAGGSLARRLGALYDYMQKRLLKANVENDEKGFEEVASLMRTLKSAWDGIAKEVR